MSGLDIDGQQIRKGAAESVKRWVTDKGGTVPADLDPIVESVSRSGATPLVVADGKNILGVIELKDVVKQGIREKFDQMRQMGIRTVMITGDNPLTAAAIAQEAGRRRLPGRGHPRSEDGPDQEPSKRAASSSP